METGILLVFVFNIKCLSIATKVDISSILQKESCRFIQTYR
jgi:hypothetical protein